MEETVPRLGLPGSPTSSLANLGNMHERSGVGTRFGAKGEPNPSRQFPKSANQNIFSNA